MVSENERAAILSAVKAAEAGISGEIVPCIVDCSDTYPAARWKAGTFAAAVAWVALFLVEWYRPHLLPVDPLLAYAFIPLLAFLVGGVAGFCPPIVRLFVGRAEIAERVERRAKETFLDLGLFKTRRRTGVLIFVSLLEHRAVVLGDEGINAKVQKSDWDAALAPILKDPSVGQGIVAAVGLCRDLLLKNGFTADTDDKNELPDDLR